MVEQPIRLGFDGATLVVSGAAPERLAALPHCQADPRSGVRKKGARTWPPHLKTKS
jgi:hypothetical protein